MGRYRADENLPYFCTITVLDWFPIFIDQRYIEPIFDRLRYCRDNKGLRVHALVVMPNHLHMIASADGDVHVIMRDFKRYTSRSIHDRLKEDGRETLVGWLRQSTAFARRGKGELGLWRPGFHPQAIYSRGVLDQKMGYLQANPVRKGLVASPADWRYSSAR